jgi:hypothetical protein
LDICDLAWDEALHAMTVQQGVVGALNDMQHMWECPGGPNEYIDALTHGIVNFRSILQVSKFHNTNYQCNTVGGKNQCYADSTSYYSKANCDFTVLVEDRREASMSTAGCQFAK